MADELLQDLAQYKTSKDKSKLSYKTRSLCPSLSLSCQGNLKCSFGDLKPDIIQIMEDWEGWRFFFGGGRNHSQGNRGGISRRQQSIQVNFYCDTTKILRPSPPPGDR